MVVRLVVTNGEYAGRELRIRGSRLLIGRAKDCHLRLYDPSVSRHHCVIMVEEEGVAVRDLHSRGGTFVNARRVQEQCDLNDGNRLRVGRTGFEVRLHLAAEWSLADASDRDGCQASSDDTRVIGLGSNDPPQRMGRSRRRRSRRSLVSTTRTPNEAPRTR
jgi:predicted component of type VI protein secretion system